MKLSFTTLGCPDWTLSEIVDKAKSYGFGAIDFRGLAGEMQLYLLPEFSSQLEQTRGQIHDAGLVVSGFSSSVNLCRFDQAEANVQEIVQYSKLCKFFEVTYIRVFGGKLRGMPREEALEKASEHWKQLANIAGAEGAKLLLETHDDWVDNNEVRKLIEMTDSEHIGVLWDVHHTYRMANESPETTVNILGKWIENTHWKDSKITESGAAGEPPKFSYCFMGEGDVPLKQALHQLQMNGYNGFYTLEWEKKWHPELPDADEAFPQYVQYMRNASESAE